MKIPFLAGLLAAASPAAADNSALLAALDAARFFDQEDYAQEATLRAAVEARGVVALFSSRRIVHLDAEDLAEMGMGEGLLAIGPLFRSRGGRIEEFATITADDGATYSVRLNGREYPVYTAADIAAGADIWTMATVVFFRMVNDGLHPTTRDRFYALNDGNDLSGVFLPPEIVPFFAQAGFVDGDSPYMPGE